MTYELNTLMSARELTDIVRSLLREVGCSVAPRQREALAVTFVTALTEEEFGINDADDTRAGANLGVDSSGPEGSISLGWGGQFTPGRFMTVRIPAYVVADCGQTYDRESYPTEITVSVGEDDTRHPTESKFFSKVLGDYAEKMVEKARYGEVRPDLAEKALASHAGQSWGSPQEMETDSKGDYPHGFVDETSEGFRVWHDLEEAWLNI